jgi:hypothetical protein
MDELIVTTVTDARWFPLRFDAREDAIQFAWVSAEMQRAVTFLSDLRPGLDQLRVLPRAEVAKVQVYEAPLHLILHSGLDGSTLLARALAQPGIVTTLKEPPILTDISAYGLRAPPIEAERIRRQVTRLLARAFCPGEAIVVKMSSIGNGLVAAMTAERPASRILCMHAPLATMLASLAAKGPEGRKAGRRLYFGLKNSLLGELGFTENRVIGKIRSAARGACLGGDSTTDRRGRAAVWSGASPLDQQRATYRSPSRSPGRNCGAFRYFAGDRSAGGRWRLRSTRQNGSAIQCGHARKGA